MSSKDTPNSSTSRRGTSSSKKNAFCSFCRKSYRDVGPLVEGPGDVYICSECIELCQSILEQENRRRGPETRIGDILTPRSIVEHLDQYVLGRPLQSVFGLPFTAYKRLNNGWNSDSDVEMKNNILLAGPTGRDSSSSILARMLNVICHR